MASHFKWYPSSEEVIVPWNARYSYPSQANKAIKMTPRIPPKNGATFLPGNVIRVEFPAQGYVNPQNTTLEFDVTLTGSGTANDADNYFVRFQNNIQSIFSRVRLLYGATPIEDIINYNVIVRNLTEWTATNQECAMDQSTIADGIGGTSYGVYKAADTAALTHGFVVARQNHIQGIDQTHTNATPVLAGAGYVPNQSPTGSCTRRYQINFALGLFTQDKLIPTKFMASQLAIELTLENVASCLFARGTLTANPTYSVGNVNLIPEIMEFDSSYDAMFLKGLRDGGVPIKFSSWHTFIFGTGGSSNVNLLVQERSRSVKALFVVQRLGTGDITRDSGATFFSTTLGEGTLQNFQFRIGGRYYPAAPVQCSTDTGTTISNGGCEAYTELAKALNVVGDYRLSSGVNTTRWAMGANTGNTLNDQDYTTSIVNYSATGRPVVTPSYALSGGATGVSRAGALGSQCFVMATGLETSNGIEISGLNAEEQSDIAVLARWSGAQPNEMALEVYTFYDAMMILRENNVLELIQ